VVWCDIAGSPELSEWRGHNVFSVACDVSDTSSIQETLSLVSAKHGPIDILINNAGVVQGKSIHELTVKDIQRSFDVNVLAHFWFIKSLLPSMVKRNSGHLVSISSVLGTNGVPMLSDYCATKAAVIGMMESIRREINQNDYNIGTTLVCPAKINTHMFKSIHQNSIIPTLDAHYVADQILNAVVYRRPTLFLPSLTNMCYLTKLLPTRIEDELLRIVGVSEAMKTFTKSEQS